MVQFSLSFLITLTLACSGAVDDSDRSAKLATGPGAVAAPDEVSITYTVSGSGSPALVFIHGWMCDQTFWSAQVRAFESENTVVTIDLPGHGQSGMERDGWTLTAFGADVQTVVENLNLTEVVLIGHSMGGPVALEAARLMPKRAIGVIAVDSLQDADAKYDPEQMKGRLAAFESDFVGTCEQVGSGLVPSEGAHGWIEGLRFELGRSPLDLRDHALCLGKGVLVLPEMA